MTPAEEASLLGVRFRDLVLKSLLLGEKAAVAKWGASVFYRDQFAAADALWEEVLTFMRGQLEAAKPKPAATPKKPDSAPNGVVKQ